MCRQDERGGRQVWGQMRIQLGTRLSLSWEEGKVLQNISSRADLASALPQLGDLHLSSPPPSRLENEGGYSASFIGLLLELNVLMHNVIGKPLNASNYKISRHWLTSNIHPQLAIYRPESYRENSSCGSK